MYIIKNEKGPILETLRSTAAKSHAAFVAMKGYQQIAITKDERLAFVERHRCIAVQCDLAIR